MKKLLFALVLLTVLVACRRPRVRHDHSKQMQAIRLPVDSAQKNDIATDDSWKDEDLIALPEDIKEVKAPAKKKRKAPANVDEQIERMMMGQDDGFGELPE